MQLQTLYFGDDDAVAKYDDAAYWNALAKGQLSYCVFWVSVSILLFPVE